VTGARIAVVHDWLDAWGGGENVLAEILHAYPAADLFTLVDFLPDALRPLLGGRRARTTFLQHVPGARRHFRMLLPLFPRAIESLDVTAYDLVISSSHAVAKSVRTAPAQIHVCYCHTPMRYAWDLRDQYLRQRGFATGLRGALANRILDRLRLWDRQTSGRVTHFVANSDFVRDRIARCYGRASTVIHPPVDTLFFVPDAHPRDAAARDYYFAASRWVPYKRMDLIAAAFRALPTAGSSWRATGRKPTASARPPAQRRIRGSRDARADARSPARRARIPVRGGGGLRHPAGRGAGVRHAGDCVWPRRRAGNGPRPRGRPAHRAILWRTDAGGPRRGGAPLRNGVSADRSARLHGQRGAILDGAFPRGVHGVRGAGKGRIRPRRG